MPRAGHADEKKIKEACETILKRLALGNKPNYASAAREHGVHVNTLRMRFQNFRKSRNEAALDRMFLSPSEEETLVTWMEVLGASGSPIPRKATSVTTC
ncbi:unnamed protein product [Mycena citricolor]|uniref:Uncharacterized protein n=1 Tax=Mycena citricolor TaxID=2018698 RepID=A0AAD2HY25_9AGAR|nr:unnamed protein product [Mycena citricolor]